MAQSGTFEPDSKGRVALMTYPPLEGGSNLDTRVSAEQIRGGVTGAPITPPRKILADFSTLPQGEGWIQGKSRATRKPVKVE